MAFEGDLVLADWNGTVWIVNQPFTYIIDDTTKAIVPEGFPTDMASVPQLLWNILPPQGGSFADYGQAAVLHDYLYRYATIINYKTNQKETITQKQADTILFDAMTSLNVASWVKYVIYYGVRIGGFTAWDKWRKLDKENIQ